MSYTSRAEIETLLPDNVIEEACDQDGNGEEDDGVFAALLALIETEVDALVYTDANPDGDGATAALLTSAARALLCDALYRRRGTVEKENPYLVRAQEARERLRRIGQAVGSVEYGETTPTHTKAQMDLL